jgi:pimeloyl-ACP methyl ester carboxylesterase
MEQFRWDVGEADLDELRRRAREARFPRPIGDAAAESGLTLDRLKALVTHWGGDFDWREVERRLNEVPQFTTVIDGQLIHFARIEGVGTPGARRVPIIVFHGWPYSFIEMLPLARELAGTEVDGVVFDVVVPSLPGYGPSAALDGAPFTGPVVAELMHSLMTDVLGYSRYLSYGEDVGSTTSDFLAALHPESVAGLIATHAAFPPPSRAIDLTPVEQRWVDWHDGEWKRASAYAALQSTRPETLAVALSDSPAGLAAWIIEKLLAWSGPGDWWSDDELLTTASLYWFTGSIGSSFAAYRDYRLQPELPLVSVPVAVAVQHGERGFPRSYAERTYTDIHQWADLSTGGHFSAWQTPQLVAAEIRSFTVGHFDPAT